jgi:hypothetical protein
MFTSVGMTNACKGFDAYNDMHNYCSHSTAFTIVAFSLLKVDGATQTKKQKWICNSSRSQE